MKLSKYSFLLICGMIISFCSIAQRNDNTPWGPSKNHKPYKGTKSNISRNKKVNSQKETYKWSSSIGFGTSYGGYGVKMAYRPFDRNIISIQGGIGYYFGDIFYNSTMKFRFVNNLYFDIKYGSFMREYDLDYDIHANINETTRIISGPGIMLGYELLFNRFGFNLGGGFNYNATDPKKLFYSYDIGLIFKI